MPRRLPIFPLGTVLLPYGVLPLHIFEQRYRALMSDLLGATGPEREGSTADAEMGIVLIERGHEVGGGDERSDLGTVARIVRAERFPDGRWFALACGVRRFSVSSWLPDDPYPLADVDDLPPDRWDVGHEAQLRSAEKEVRRALALAGELGEAAPQPNLTDDPLVASWQLCNAVPVGSFDRQRLLATDDIGERLELLAEQAREASAMLAFRLAN